MTSESIENTSARWVSRAVFRIGLVGAGRMGQTHLAALSTSTEVTVAAIVEPHSDTAASLSSQGFTTYDSIDALVAAGGVDGYLVATPSAFHVDAVRRLSVSGLPILCEKPAGLSVDDASEIARIVSDARVRLQIGYWRRFVPSLRDLKSRIDAGTFGRLLVIHASQWDHRPPAPEFRNTSGGILVDMGVHEIDMIRWISGHDVLSLSSNELMSDEPGVVDQDAGVFTMRLSTETLGFATLGRYYPGADFVGIEVMGELDHERIAILSGDDGDAALMSALRAQAEAFARGSDPHAATIDDAVSALRAVNTTTEMRR